MERLPDEVLISTDEAEVTLPAGPMDSGLGYWYWCSGCDGCNWEGGYISGDVPVTGL
jgi:hypothetical protein